MPFNPETGKQRCGGCGGEFDLLPVDAVRENPDLYRELVSDQHEFIHAGCPGSDREDGNYHEQHDHAAVAAHFRERHNVDLPDPAPVGVARPLNGGDGGREGGGKGDDEGGGQGS